MTRARSLKLDIRTRAAKTGERYTTARRHVLEARDKASRAARAPMAPDTSGVPAPTTAAAANVVGRARTGGATSDAVARARTGFGLDHWFAVLDTFGATTKGHTDAAAHLRERHGIDGWYAQGITVAYERARGIRVPNQACDGRFQVSASKTMRTTVDDLVRLVTSRPRRAAWLRELDVDLAVALEAAFAGVPKKPVPRGTGARPSKGFVVRDDGLTRVRFKWGRASVEWRLTPKSGGKLSVVVDHTGLADAAAVDRHRAAWKPALARLASLLEAMDG
ncbi:MAG: hypothetical protein U0Q12_24510 [Vicinamibacterales bacterium]